MQSLNTNFAIVRQCLLKIQELEGSLGQEKQSSREFSERLRLVESNTKLNQDEIRKNDEKVRELQGNVGDEFMVPLGLARKECTESRRRPRTCSRLRTQWPS